MSFSLNSNIPAMNATLNLNMHNTILEKSLAMIASGSKLDNAAYDVSGLGMANDFASQASSMGQYIMNLNDSVGMVQMADGAMRGISENTDKMKDLSIRASSLIMNSDDRLAIQKEMNGLMKSSNQIATTTSFNGIHLLDGSGTSSIGADARGSSLFSSPIDVTTQAGALAALDTIDAGRAKISDIRSTLGATQNQLVSDIKNTSVGQINAVAAASQIGDVDYAAESANFSKNNLMTQVGAFVQSQSNISAASVTRLFQ
jgi:flagellin